MNILLKAGWRSDWRGKQHLRITGHPNVTHLIAVVNQVDLPDFHVVIRGDRDLHIDRDVMIAALEFGLMRIKGDVLVITGDGRGLVSR